VDYDLSRIGPREFEQLSQALVQKYLGAAVEVFGDGPDGGREATFKGTSTWSEGEGAQSWNGYHVIQVKYHHRSACDTREINWLRDQLRREFIHWTNPDSGRRRRGHLPEYLLVITNALLTPAENGGIRQIGELVESFRDALKLKDWKIWHYDKICRLLDDSYDIRRAYSGLITPGDVFADIHHLLGSRAASVGVSIRNHAAKELVSDRGIRLETEKNVAGQTLDLSEIAVDLPALRGRGPSRTVQVVAHVIRHGDSMLRPDPKSEREPHLVLVGGPGQGKSTVGQLIAQAYRASMVVEDETVWPDARHVAEETIYRLGKIHVPKPRSIRWPIRIELASYSDALASGKDLPVTRWIANQIASRGGDDVSVSEVKAWLAEWPWVVILDGLDEVASIRARQLLMHRIHDFLYDAHAVKADLLVVVTTRPQGYAGEFDRGTYEHLILQSLEPDHVNDLVSVLVPARYPHNAAMREEVLSRLHAAIAHPLTARLMRTPLQVTVMTSLLERRPRPPQDRYALFDAYYETIYAREAEKRGELAEVLSRHQPYINAIHERVGITLQMVAEKDGDAEAGLASAELRQLTLERLTDEEYEPEEAAELAQVLEQAATDRIVLLVPKRDNEIGFEVRSLQEFMAARAIVSGSDDFVISRLTTIAPSAHWRNTWLLAAGRIFATREYLRQRLISLTSELDMSSTLTYVLPSAPQLAFDLLEDDLARHSPQFRRQLLRLALDVFNHPPTSFIERNARLLAELARNSADKPLIIDAIERAMSGTADRCATAYLTCGAIPENADHLSPDVRRLLGGVSLDRYQSEALRSWYSAPQTHMLEGKKRSLGVGEGRLGDYVRSALSDTHLKRDGRRSINRMAAELDDGLVIYAGSENDRCVGAPRADANFRSQTGAAAVLLHPDASEALARTLMRIPATDWPATAAIRGHLFSAWQRLPVADTLAELMVSDFVR
jgi:hypothetical protein